MPTPPKISESVDVFSHGRDVFIESHVPWVDSRFYHAHPSIEINYLRDCEMRYSFSGDPVDVPRERLCMFWAAYPHRVTHVFGQGRITNAYVTLQQFLNWSLPPDMVDQVMSGAIICSLNLDPLDQPLVARWANELDNSNPELQRLHRHEVRAPSAAWHRRLGPDQPAAHDLGRDADRRTGSREFRRDDAVCRLEHV